MPLDHERMNRWMLESYTNKMKADIDKTNLTLDKKEEYKILIDHAPQEDKVSIYQMAISESMVRMFDVNAKGEVGL